MTLNERIVELCQKKGISQSQLERDLGIAKGSVTKWKTKEPRPSTLRKVADYLNVSVTYLMNGEEAEQPTLTRKNERDIGKALKETLDQLDSQDGLMFDGEALDDNTKELLKISLENTIRTAKIAAKKKFTPKSIQNGDD